MSKICIIRHGQTQYNVNGQIQGQHDSALTAQGIAQAQECGRFLQNHHFDYIITSPLGRAVESCEYINAYLHLPVYIDERLKERNFGYFEGQVLNAVLEQLQITPDYYFQHLDELLANNGETQKQLDQRAAAFLAEIIEKKDDVLIITHAQTIKALLRYLHHRYYNENSDIIPRNMALNSYEITDDKLIILAENQPISALK